jgi:hypothetical protein
MSMITSAIKNYDIYFRNLVIRSITPCLFFGCAPFFLVAGIDVFAVQRLCRLGLKRRMEN